MKSFCDRPSENFQKRSLCECDLSVWCLPSPSTLFIFELKAGGRHARNLHPPKPPRNSTAGVFSNTGKSKVGDPHALIVCVNKSVSVSLAYHHFDIRFLFTREEENSDISRFEVTISTMNNNLTRLKSNENKI